MKELLSEEHYSYKIRTPFMNTPPFLYGLPPSMDLWRGSLLRGFFKNPNSPINKGFFFFKNPNAPINKGGSHYSNKCLFFENFLSPYYRK